VESVVHLWVGLSSGLWVFHLGFWIEFDAFEEKESWTREGAEDGNQN